MFTWVPFYRELAVKILQFREAQPELIGMLKELKAEPHNIPMIQLNDKDHEGNTPELTHIDPFTFFAAFNRGVKDENRLSILKYLKEKLSIQADLPSDFGGIPVVDNMQSWFFPYLSNDRRPDDIPKLWELAQAVVHTVPEDLDAELFARCLDIYLIALPKLTMGMFWFNAPEYLAFDGKMKAYFAAHGIGLQSADLVGYRRLIERVHETLGDNHPQISYDAWKFSQDKKRYWAGGHSWDDESQLQRFERDSIWQNGFKRGEPKGEKSWQLFDQIQIGDEFAIKGANFGKVKIYSIGRVTGKQEAEGILLLEKLDRQPLYNGGAKWGQDAGAWNTTLLEVTRPDIIQKIFHPEASEAPDNIGEDKANSQMQNYPLNQILYGPPGTGKTYNSIERAVEIIDSQKYSTHAEAKARFDELRREGRIGFVTFHQSFGYEDFVEGIRPVMDESNREAHYEIRDGVLKEMALQAIGVSLEPSEPAAQGRTTFESIWEALLHRIESEPERKYRGLSSQSEYLLEVTQQNNIAGHNIRSEYNTTFNCSATNAQKVWESFPQKLQVNTVDVQSVIHQGAHKQFIAAVVNELKRMVENSENAFISSPPVPIDEKLRAESFLLSRRSFRLLQENQPRYVLIIDEINRGNISKILGELITLLESDKRLGGDNELVVTLPYSGANFVLPPNLYILGTMNTADKSLALLDVALRRRFKFIEYSPDFSVCRQLSDKTRKILAELNHRIVLSKDRDHRIGHSFFVKVKSEEEFNEVFRFDIIPLLQEYFYNDWDGLRFVLGEDGENGKFIRALKSEKTRGVRNRWQWYFDEREDHSFNSLQTLMANYFAPKPADDNANGST